MSSSRVKRIVCLANSRRDRGRCIAGKDTKGKHEWIRPVSERESEEVDEEERQYEDGGEPCVLDVIEIPLLEYQPKNHQRENWLLDPNYYWEKVERFSETDLAILVDPIESLWIDGQNTSGGKNDKIDVASAHKLQDSLRFIEVDNLQAVVLSGEYPSYRKRRVRGRFLHAGMPYNLSVTDPKFERTYRRKGDGEHEVGPCYLTVSLAGAFKGACYKLIAAVIPKKGS